MKKRFRKSQNEEASIELMPLLDVVFILLIFFIVTTSFVKESGIDVLKPTAKTATKKDKASIFVAIKDNGDIWIQKRKIDVHSVRANIEKLHAESPEGHVVIQADTRSKTGILIQVMDQIRAANVENISIAANPNEASSF